LKENHVVIADLTAALTATELGISDEFNAATYFVDRNVHEGRGDKVAIECGDERVTYQQVLENTNRVGTALRDELGLRREERVVLLMLDGPEYAYSFFGSIKIGAIPIPLNTLLRPEDYRYVLNDCRARVCIVSASLLPQLQAIPADQLRHLRDIIVVGESLRDTGTGYRVRRFSELLDRGSPELEAELTSKDDAAFWLYSSGSTGFPKGCVHLQHDMVVCTELYARGILQLTDQVRCFCVAKLLFAYGLGNALYFPIAE
jgi:benzoate-CoA ligase